MSIYLQGRAPRTLDEQSKIAEQYLKARNRQLHQKFKFEGQKYKTENPNYEEMNEEKMKEKLKDLMSHANSARSMDIELRIAFTRDLQHGTST